MPKATLALQAEQRILILRDQKVMLDFHLAELYDVETRALKQACPGVAQRSRAVCRNPERFPEDFMFDLTHAEAELLVSQTVIPGLGKLGGAAPMAFASTSSASLPQGGAKRVRPSRMESRCTEPSTSHRHRSLIGGHVPPRRVPPHLSLFSSTILNLQFANLLPGNFPPHGC